MLCRGYLEWVTEQMKIKRRQKIQETMERISALKILRVWRKRKMDQNLRKLTPIQKSLLGGYLHKYNRRLSIKKQLHFPA